MGGRHGFMGDGGRSAREYNAMIEWRERERKWKAEAHAKELDPLPALAKRAEQGDVQAMRETAQLLATHYQIRLVESPTGDRNMAAFRHGERVALIAPIVDLDTLAIALHEMGHGIEGDCPNRGEHYAERNGNVVACLACETAAWRAALDAVPFSREMFARLQDALASYRSTTPGTAAARAALDETTSTRMYMGAKQRHLTLAMRRERQQRVEAEVARDAERRH